MIRQMSLLAISASTALLLAAPATFARNNATRAGEQPSTSTESTTHMMSDSAFAKAATEGGMAEVKLGQLAQDKGTTPAVKDFGKRMVTDHSKIDDQLKTAASNDKITLPSGLDAKDEATYNELSKLSGEAFDQAYARDMVRDHVSDIAAFRQESKDGKDASIKSFASATLPTLESHLKQAREMQSSVSSANHNQAKKQQS